ncbi:MAG: hypothetical protein GWP07_03020 [Xanthomonadaceae bacterium]|nr:hypothetical protein [Xanthomonadaceae bacterium]
MILENNYDIICRDGSLGALLTAFFLAKSGKKVLLLPPLSSPAQKPSYLLPLIAGFPRQLLAQAGLLTEGILCKQSNWFSWTDGQHVFNCPSVFSDRMPVLSSFMGDNFPWFQSHFTDFQNIWDIIDTVMSNGLMIPAVGLKDHGKILMALVKYQELLQNRRMNAENFYSDTSLPEWLSNFFASMVPQISLFRYENLPLVSFAYGIATMFQDAELVNLENLQNYVKESILEKGGKTSPADYQVIFDGKWYIGIGTEGKVEIRSRAFITDSDEKTLKSEIPPMHQRRDFFRQFVCQQKGIALNRLYGHIAGMKKLPETGRWFYNANNSLQAVMLQRTMASEGLDINVYFSSTSPGHDPTDFTTKLLARLPELDILDASRINFQPQTVEKEWGCQPKLPPVMGGAFLPVISTYKKFYHVGWENLPGFGFSGLVYAARKTADRIILNEYR